MKKIVIAVSLLSIFNSCTTGGSGSGTSTTPSADTTFNGSYFQISYGGKSFYAKDASVNNTFGHIVVLTATGGSGVFYSIALVDASGVYGLVSGTHLNFSYIGTGTGVFSLYGPSNVIQQNPFTEYTDTSGTVTVSYSGSDYIQGTFATTLFATGFSYPATGSFKIYH